MALVAYIMVPTFWAGLLIGVCYVAGPAKFLARPAARPAAPDRSRDAFTVWNDTEWAILALLVFPLLFVPASRFTAISTLLLGILLLTQSTILLPALDARVQTIQAGGRPAVSFDHKTYLAVDALKLLILATIAWKQCGEIAFPVSP
jgi:hypothetical protein